MVVKSIKVLLKSAYFLESAKNCGIIVTVVSSLHEANSYMPWGGSSAPQRVAGVENNIGAF